MGTRANFALGCEALLSTGCVISGVLNGCERGVALPAAEHPIIAADGSSVVSRPTGGREPCHRPGRRRTWAMTHPDRLPTRGDD